MSEVVIRVLGLSRGQGHEFKSGEGVGKSCLCYRFLNPGYDDYISNHPSILALHEFESPAVNNVHFLFWGTALQDFQCGKGTLTAKIHVVENTILYQDETSRPFNNSEKPDNIDVYMKQALGRMESPGKVSFWTRDAIALPGSYYPQPYLDYSHASTLKKGFIVVCDVSIDGLVFDAQLQRVKKICQALKKNTYIVAATKTENAIPSSVEHLQRLKKKLNFDLISTSAALHYNTLTVFRILAGRLLKLMHEDIPSFEQAAENYLVYKTRAKRSFDTFATKYIHKSDERLEDICRTQDYLACREAVGKYETDRLYAFKLLELKNRELDSKPDGIEKRQEYLEEYVEKHPDLALYKMQLRMKVDEYVREVCPHETANPNYYRTGTPSSTTSSPSINRRPPRPSSSHSLSSIATNSTQHSSSNALDRLATHITSDSQTDLNKSSGKDSEEDENYVDMENPCAVTPSQPCPLTPSQPQPLTPSQTRPLTPSQQRPLTPSQQRPLTPSQQRPLTPSQPQPLTPSSSTILPIAIPPLGPTDNEDAPSNQATNEANVKEPQDTAKPTPNARKTGSTREWVTPSPTSKGAFTAFEDCRTTQTVRQDGPFDDGKNGSTCNQAQDLPLEHSSTSPTSLTTASSPPIAPKVTGKKLDEIREKLRREKDKKEAEMTLASQQSNNEPSNKVTESPPHVANSAQVKLPPKPMPKPVKKPRAITPSSKIKMVPQSDSINRYAPSPVTPTAKFLMPSSSSSPDLLQLSAPEGMSAVHLSPTHTHSSGEEYLPTDDNLSEIERSSEHDPSPPPAVPVRTKNYHEVILPPEHAQQEANKLTSSKKNNSSPGALSSQKETSPPVDVKMSTPSRERKARNKRKFYERWRPQKDTSKKAGREAKSEASPSRSEMSKKKDTKKSSNPSKVKKSHSTCDRKSKPYLQRVTSDPARTPPPQVPTGSVPRATFMNMKRRPLPQVPFMMNDDDSCIDWPDDQRDYDVVDHLPPANSLPRNFQPASLAAFQDDHFQRRPPPSQNIDFDYVNEDEFPRPSSQSFPTTHPLSRQSLPEAFHSPSRPCPPPTSAERDPRSSLQPLPFAEPKQHSLTRRVSDLSPDYDYPQIHGIIPPGNIPQVSHGFNPRSSHPAALSLLTPAMDNTMRKSHSTDFDRENDQYVEMSIAGGVVHCREKLPDDDDYQNWEVIKSIKAKRSQSMEDIQLYKNIPINSGRGLPLSIMNQPASIPLPSRQAQQFVLPPRNIPRTSQDISSSQGLQLSPPHQSPAGIHMPQYSLPASFQPTFLPTQCTSPFMQTQSYLPPATPPNPLVIPGHGLRRSDETLCSAAQSHTPSPHNSPRAFPHVAQDTGQELSLSNKQRGAHLQQQVQSHPPHLEYVPKHSQQPLTPRAVTSSVGTSTWTSENDPTANYYNVVSESNFRQPPTSISLPQNNAYLDVISD